MEFRRNIGGITWHWRKDCPEWPGLYCCIMVSMDTPDSSCLCPNCSSQDGGIR